MSAIAFLWRRSIRNKIRETLHKPGILILYVLMAALLVALLIMGSDAAPAAVQDADVYACFLVGIFLFIFLLSVVQGFKQGAGMFSMPDVNLLFLSPLSPRRILLYAVFKQGGILVLASLLLLFQYPNMRNAYGLPPVSLLGLMLGYIGVGLASQLVSLHIYAYCAGAPQRRARLERACRALCIVGAVALGYAVLTAGQPLSGLRAALGGDWWDYVPLVGWARGVAMGVALGNPAEAAACLALLALGNVGLVLLMQHTRMDYYEDVLVSAEQAFAAKEAAAQGRMPESGARVSRRVKRAVRPLAGAGASAFAYRILREQGRRGWFSWLVDWGTLCAVGIPLLCRLMFTDMMAEAGLWPLLAMAAYLMLFFNLTSSLNRELTVPYLYLAPAGAFAKLAAILCPNALKALADGAAFALSAGILLALPGGLAAIGGVCYASVAILYAAGLVLVERVLGGSKNKALVMLVYFIGLLVLVAPGLVAAILLSVWLPTLCYLIWAGCNLLLAALVVFLCRNLLARPET